MFNQFDAEGDGTADISTIVDVLKASNSNAATGTGADLGHVIRSLQACSLTPGVIDVYNEDKSGIAQHGKRILNVSFYLRVPISATHVHVQNKSI